MRAAADPASRWRLLPAALPVRAWRDGELALVCAAVEAVLLEWAGAWDLPQDAAAPVACAGNHSDARAATDWLPLGGQEQCEAWLRWNEGERTRLACVWFGAGAGATPIVHAVAQACQEDVTARLAKALGLADFHDPSQPPGVMWRAWSGAVAVNLPCGAQLALQASLVSRLLRRGAVHGNRMAEGPALVQLARAISHSSLRLRAEIDGCELSLGELQELQPGDVLRLPHPVDTPLGLVHSDGLPLFRGWLARSSGRRAVELAPASMPATGDESAKELR